MVYISVQAETLGDLGDACEAEDLETIKKLLAQGADLDSTCLAEVTT